MSACSVYIYFHPRLTKVVVLDITVRVGLKSCAPVAWHRIYSLSPLKFQTETCNFLIIFSDFIQLELKSISSFQILIFS